MGIALSEKHVASKVTYNGFAPKTSEESPLPAEPAELLPRVKYGPWRRVSTAGSIHTMFLREDEEITTTDTWTNAQVMKAVAMGIFAFSPQLGSCL